MNIKEKYPEMLKEVEFDSEEQWMAPLVNRVALERPIGQTKPVIVRDDTLRSGANTPGVYASNEQKMELAEKLEAIGIVEAEIGYPSIPEHVEFVKILKQKGSKLQVGLHTRYYDPEYRREIKRAVEAGADLVNLIGFIEERVYDAVSYAKSLGARVAIGMDYHRLDLVARFVPAAVDGGADRIVIYDARGWFVPQTLAFLVRYVRALVDPNVEIGVHCHNDMGLSTINTIEAIRAGACACDVTVLSTGHRCGNAALEQVVPALEVLYGISTGIDMRQLCELAELVERLYGVPIPTNVPIVGRQMFSYGGSHIAGILRGKWYLWENMRAEAVGNKRYITFGATSLRRGKTGPLYAKVQQMDYDPDSGNMDRVYEALEPLIQQRKELTEPEVEEIIHQVYQGK
jgi:isopropylmalate/homocitrate/citramalate synthase